MAEYNKNTDWGSVIDGLRLCIDKLQECILTQRTTCNII